MIQFIGNGLRAVRSGLKSLAHRNPILLAGVRSVRSMLTRRPATTSSNLLGELDPLHPDRSKLAKFAELSPTLPDEMMSAFVEIAEILRGVDTGVADGHRFLNYYAIDPQFSICRDLNIVYSPPKVGGTTMAATLQQHPSFQSTVHHVHYISASGIAFVDRMKARFPDSVWNENLLRARWLRVLLAINRALQTKNPSNVKSIRKPFVMAGVREPVALHLSACFEAWQVYGATPDLLTADFIHKRLSDVAWHRVCNNWFDGDLKTTFGIDVFARPFPAEQGWDIYENENARVLLIRQESLAQLSNAVGTLYGFAPNSFPVLTSNSAENKDYAAIYDNTKKRLRLSSQELDEIYGLPYVQHFYTQKEIGVFKKRWKADEGICKAA